MKPFFSKLTAALLILFSLLGLSLEAQAQCTGGVCFISSDSSADTSILTDENPLGSGEPQDVEQALQSENQEDQQRCEEELGFNSLANKAGSLPNVLANGLTQQFPQTLSGFMTEALPGIIQERLAATLPQALNVGLRDALPNYVNNALSDLVAGGLSNEAISAQLPTIINQGVADLTPKILNREIPTLIQSATRESMPRYLGSQFSQQAPEILRNNPQFIARIEELTQTLSSQLGAASKTGNETISDLRNQINGAGSAFDLDKLLSGSLLPTKINATSQALITEGVLDGVASTTAESVAASPELANISRTLAPVIAQLIGQQVIPSLLQTFQGAFTESGNRIGNVDTTINGLLGRNYDFSRGVLGDSFFSPVVNSISQPLNSWVGAGMQNLGTSIQYNIPLVKVGEFNSIGNTPILQTNPEAASALGINPGDQVIMPSDLGSNVSSSLSNVSTQAGSAVTANAGKIGAQTAAQSGLQNLGNGLNAGISQGIGGMVGNLVGNIPYVGGLLGGIVNQLVTTLVSQALGAVGLGASGTGVGSAAAGDAGLPWDISGSTGIATSVLGNTLATNMGFAGSNQNTGQISGNTKTSNQNEERSYELQNKQQEIAIQACTHAKALERMQKKQEEARFVYDREARKKAWTSFATMFDSWLKASGKSYNVSGVPNADQGQNGQSIVADYQSNVDQATEEAITRVISSVKNDQNNYGTEVEEALWQSVADKNSAANQALTQAEIDSLSHPEDLDPAVFRERYLKYLAHNPRGVAVDKYNEILREVASDRAEARDRFVAYQGFNETRQCNGWLPDDNGAMQCVSWTTLTPGSTNAGYMLNLLTSIVRWFENSDQVGEDFVTEVADGPASVVTNLKQATQQGLPAASTNSQSLCPGPGPCQETGYTPGAGSNSALSQTISNSFTNLQQLNQTSSSGSGSSSGINFNLDDLESLANSAPAAEISFSQTGDSLTWSTQNAIYCRAKNAWAGSSPAVGDDNPVALQGSVAISPETPSGRYAIECYNPWMKPAEKTIDYTQPGQ